MTQNIRTQSSRLTLPLLTLTLLTPLIGCDSEAKNDNGNPDGSSA